MCADQYWLEHVALVQRYTVELHFSRKVSFPTAGFLHCPELLLQFWNHHSAAADGKPWDSVRPLPESLSIKGA